MSLLLVLATLCFTISGLVVPSNKPIIQVSKQESASTLNATLLNFFDLGIKRIYTDILWIQTLLESDLEHYKGNDGNSWMFHRFYTIAALDPQFIENYWYGGQYLSVIKDDDVGAQILFEKGLEVYPNDTYLLYYAGSHYLLELNDKKNALKYYEKIFDHPKTPEHIRALVSRLKAEEGFLKESFYLMQQLYNQAPEGSSLKKAYHKRLYAIKAERDLTCLNARETPCDHVDLDGRPYIQKHGVYKSQQKWEKLRLYRRKKGKADSNENK